MLYPLIDETDFMICRRAAAPPRPLAQPNRWQDLHGKSFPEIIRTLTYSPKGAWFTTISAHLVSLHDCAGPEQETNLFTRIHLFDPLETPAYSHAFCVRHQTRGLFQKQPVLLQRRHRPRKAAGNARRIRWPSSCTPQAAMKRRQQRRPFGPLQDGARLRGCEVICDLNVSFGEPQQLRSL